MAAGIIDVKLRFVSSRLECVVEGHNVFASEIVILRHRHKERRQPFWYRRHVWKRGAVNRSRVVRARIGPYGRELGDHSAGGESREDDAIRRDAPFGGMGAHYFNSLDAVRNTVLAVLGDQSVVAKLSPETCHAGL